MSRVELMHMLLFWGIWILVPLFIDGLAALGQIVAVTWGQVQLRRRVLADLAAAGIQVPPGLAGRPGRIEDLLPPLRRHPLVTVVVPIRDAARTLGRTLASIAQQTYPLEAMEVICVDNGSQDAGFEVFMRFQETAGALRASWVPVERPGKPQALNAGIQSSQGAYVFAVDADVRLAPDAIHQMVRAFEYRPSLMAATGAVEIDTARRGASRFLSLLNTCEAFEYISAFRVGRRSQSIVNTLYTLSGAFSAFRREALFEDSHLYDSLTVSEDTKLTFDLRDAIEKKRINATLECVDAAVAYCEPVGSLGELYSQRLRWQRGQIEVAAIHSRRQQGILGPLSTFPGRILLVDHTLVFPRLVWTFLLFFLWLFGYSLAIVMGAMAATYLAYVLIEGLYFAAAYRFLDERHRAWLRRSWWVLAVMPTYRLVVFVCRVAGILYAVAEPPSWHTSFLGRPSPAGDRRGR